MGKPSINEVLADNLRFFMTERGIDTQAALAKKCLLSQRSISNYLSPKLRVVGSKGKEPSAKLSEVERLADALQVEVWQLLRPMSKADRVIYSKVEEAFNEVRALTTGHNDPIAITVHEPQETDRHLSRGAKVYQFPTGRRNPRAGVDPSPTGRGNPA